MVISYGKCNSCGRFGMNLCFWYCESDMEPLYMCHECYTDFDNALAAVEWSTLHGYDEMNQL